MAPSLCTTLFPSFCLSGGGGCTQTGAHCHRPKVPYNDEMHFVWSVKTFTEDNALFLSTLSFASLNSVHVHSLVRETNMSVAVARWTLRKFITISLFSLMVQNSNVFNTKGSWIPLRIKLLALTVCFTNTYLLLQLQLIILQLFHCITVNDCILYCAISL